MVVFCDGRCIHIHTYPQPLKITRAKTLNTVSTTTCANLVVIGTHPRPSLPGDLA